MKEYLPFVTIDTWTLIFTWVNLLILFLLMKKFLFGPVKKILDKREEEIHSAYQEAKLSSEKAEALRQEYTAKLDSAKQEAASILESAHKKAGEQSEHIIAEAHSEATDILRKTNIQIENEKKSAMNEIKQDISSMAVSIAEKVIEKDINEKDYEKLVEKFIDEMGAAS